MCTNNQKNGFGFCYLFPFLSEWKLFFRWRSWQKKCCRREELGGKEKEEEEEKDKEKLKGKGEGEKVISSDDEEGQGGRTRWLGRWNGWRVVWLGKGNDGKFGFSEFSCSRKSAAWLRILLEIQNVLAPDQTYPIRICILTNSYAHWSSRSS